MWPFYNTLGIDLETQGPKDIRKGGWLVRDTDRKNNGDLSFVWGYFAWEQGVTQSR